MAEFDLDEIRSLIIDTANQFLLEHMPGESDTDAFLDGRPLRRLMGKARTFNDEFRERRLPTAHTADELAKMTPDKATNSLKTYDRRIIRATVPNTLQKKANRRNFVARSSKKLNELIKEGLVHFSSLLSIIFSVVFFLLFLPLRVVNLLPTLQAVKDLGGGYYKKQTAPPSPF